MTTKSAPKRRDPYSDVARAARDTLWRANSAGITHLQRRVLEGVIALTAMYSRLEAKVYLGELASFVYAVTPSAPWQQSKVSEALRALNDAGLVRSQAPKGPSNGRGYVVAIFPSPRAASEPEPWTLSAVESHPETRARTDEPSHPDPGASRTSDRTPEPGSDSGSISPRSRELSHPDSGSQLTPKRGALSRSTEDQNEEQSGRDTPPTALDLAAKLVTSHPDEVPGILGDFIPTHGEPAVIAALTALDDTGVRFRFPSKLAEALRHALPRTTTTTASRRTQPALCGHCDNGWVSEVDEEGISREGRCPCQNPKGTT